MKLLLKICSILFLFLFSSCENRDNPVYISQKQIENINNLTACLSENDAVFSKKLPLNLTKYFLECSEIPCPCNSEYKNLIGFQKVTIAEKVIVFSIKKESGYEEVFYHDLLFLKRERQPPKEKKWDGHTETLIEKIDSNLYYRIKHVWGF